MIESAVRPSGVAAPPVAEVAVVIPCYRVRQTILQVLREMGPEIHRIYCVDDACPEQSGDLVEEQCADGRVRVLRHPSNRGVGGATMTGFEAAMQDGAHVVVKIDGDGQMDPRLVPRFLNPILLGRADYCKGNRFFKLETVRSMPVERIVGNAVLSFVTKLSSGYWHIFDPTNGYVAIHSRVLAELPLQKIHRRYFFESDLLFRLNTIGAVVEDVPMTAKYGGEPSSLRIGRIWFPFLVNHAKNTAKRIFYNHFLRNFSVASLELVLGLGCLLFGLVFGSIRWWQSTTSGVPVTAGTVMVAALPVILGTQLLLSFLNYDMRSVPSTALHKRL
jgi:glycosyltransferase involved in cell wall biosynthesis